MVNEGDLRAYLFRLSLRSPNASAVQAYDTTLRKLRSRASASSRFESLYYRNRPKQSTPSIRCPQSNASEFWHRNRDTLEDYDQTIAANAVIRPNEFVVLEFPATNQTWAQLHGPVNDVPKWDDRARGNAVKRRIVRFSFTSMAGLWISTAEPVGPDIAISGMVRSGLAFTNTTTVGNVLSYRQNSSRNWRFVGDSRASYLCNYDWQTLGNSSYASGTPMEGAAAKYLSALPICRIGSTEIMLEIILRWAAFLGASIRRRKSRGLR